MTDTRTPLEVIRDALKDIASSECGCSPVCLCDSEESLRIYKENAQDCARQALAALATIESEEPQAEETPVPVCVWHRDMNGYASPYDHQYTTYNPLPSPFCPQCGKLIVLADSPS